MIEKIENKKKKGFEVKVPKGLLDAAKTLKQAVGNLPRGALPDLKVFPSSFGGDMSSLVTIENMKDWKLEELREQNETLYRIAKILETSVKQAEESRKVAQQAIMLNRTMFYVALATLLLNVVSFLYFMGFFNWLGDLLTIVL